MASSLNLQNAEPINLLERTTKAYEALSADEKLGLLWVIYDNMGGSITPAAPGAADVQFTKTLLDEVRSMNSEAQLNFMRDLVDRRGTDHTQRYVAYTNDNKLVFWYELAELMRTGDVIPVPEGYQLSAAAARVFNDVVTLDFNEQITLLRHTVLEMGPES